MSSSEHLILIHGWMGEPGDWKSFCGELPESFSYESLCLPGHGQRSGEEIPDWPQLIEVIDEELELNSRSRKPWLVGYSLGGRICLELASREPDDFSGIILLGARPGWSSNAPVAERTTADAHWAEAILEDFPNMLQRWYKQPLFADLSDVSDFQALIRRRQKQDPEKMAQSLISWSPVHQADRRPFLKFWESPRLWISGGQDMFYTKLGEELRVAGALTDVSIQGHAGHALLTEQPEAIAGTVMHFVEKYKETV